MLKHAAKMRANNVRDPEIVETLVRAAVEITLAGDPKFENACHFFDAIQVLLGAYHDFGRYDPRAGGMSNLGVRWRAMLEADE
ncbi:hypothetical protein [Phenylobacterium sp.]|uniref:hypothetical protein n=1 Tax=Phenylobacterium sp. TaxID=1871053 RepID=UPI002C8B028D|nr:hypothetical protein [Phenylobacterium sp.]HLZ77159.1 hypothetical protein [Phenylobacterium sp.]